ncbi:MAG: MFS transporter [Streptosporangiales bacterium]|nr:MFS transporter [Streptosporangiales bacterium]
METAPVERHGLVSLLRAHAGFRTLWTARVVSFTGDSLSLVALMLHVADTTGQAIAVAVLLLVGDFVPSLLGPVSGALSDRFDLRRIMLVCELVQCVVIALIALSLPPLPLLLVLVGVRAIAGQVFQPASRSAVPALVPDRHLGPANSALGLGTNGAEAAGPLIAAALFPLIGVRGVLLVDAATFLVSALVLTRLRRLPPTETERPSLLADARTGLRYVFATPVVRVVVIGFCLVVAFNGVDDVALVLLATETFDAGGSAVALLLAGVGVGLFVGYALLGRLGTGRSMAVLLVLGFAVNSLGNLLTGLAWAVAAAIALQTVRGLGIAAMDVASNTMLQRLVPSGMLGRVFGNLYGVVGVAAAASYVGGGLLLDATSAPLTLVIAGAGGTLVAAVTAVALLRRRGTRREG